MKTKSLLLFAMTLVIPLFLGISLHAQTLKYTYDVAGNRLSRVKVVDMSGGTKSISGDLRKDKVEDVVNELKVTIYPNPTKGIMRIDVEGVELKPTSCIKIYSSGGALVRSVERLSTSNVIDISSQLVGLYMMQIVLDSEHVSVWKIIKE